MNVEDLHNVIMECKVASTLYRFAEKCIFEKPEEECFKPLTDLLGEGWTKYAEEHESEKDIYKNGIYMNDDSTQAGESIVYACLNFDVSKLLPMYNELPQTVINEFRYTLCTNMYAYFRHVYNETGALQCAYNKNTFDWDNFYHITHEGKRFGETLTL